MTDHIWTRRDGETPPAYEAFKTYLTMGAERSCAKVANALGKSTTLIEGWSVTNDWQRRTVEYDRYVLTADTDGLIHDLAESRDENLALMRKLKGHLSNRLDEFIANREDPTIRWTQALTAMAKVEQNFLMLKDDQKTSEKLDNVMELVEKAIQGANRSPA